MKIAFFWTWDFSKNILKSIIENHKEIEVWVVVSQADKPIWRKKIVTPTIIKTYAEEVNIDVLQPEKLKNNNDFIDSLKKEDYDFFIVVAYGKILSKEILEIPKYGSINIHGSILPKYRWASPIQESIKNGDKKTWLTIMYMSEWMDEWDILKIQEIDIDKDDKTIDLFKKFENIWWELLVKTLKKIILWEIRWEKQDEEKASYCSKIEKKDAEINFEKENWKKIYDKFRAYSPWPWVYSYYNWKKISIEDCSFDKLDLVNQDDFFKIWDVVEIENENWEKNKQIWIVCIDWTLILKEVKLEWKKNMDINTFVNWYKDFLDYNFN